LLHSIKIAGSFPKVQREYEGSAESF
jgi:hypothetical protein